jgi:hypothetical protein
MTSGALTREGWFGGFHGVLIGYREFLALRRMMLEMVLGVGALRKFGHPRAPLLSMWGIEVMGQPTL